MDKTKRLKATDEVCIDDIIAFNGGEIPFERAVVELKKPGKGGVHRLTTKSGRTITVRI
jgi:hypothetical protein